MTVNIQYPNIETHVQDISILPVQLDSKKEVNQELQVQVFMIEISKVWLKMESISSQDSKIVNVELLVKPKEILGELKKEVVTQVLVITESHLILVIMSLVKSKEDLVQKQLE